MRKVQIVINFILFFIFFYATKTFSQEIIQGKYKKNNIIDTFESFEFNKNGLFSFKKETDVGIHSKGKGHYKIVKDSLFLNYDLSYPNKNSYYQSRSYYNSKDSISINFSIFNFKSKPLNNVMIYTTGNTPYKSCETSLYDKCAFTFKKGDYSNRIEILIDGEFLDRQLIILAPDRNYEITAYMNKNQSIGFYHPKTIKDEKQKFKILKFSEEYIELKNSEIQFKLIKYK
ncbi:hypothetical protein [uncultured Tenacibaculum sp.]|uniref:hypothetical protein n=1 Tax=uncultured Tenacibaculum sp. TaxID=174713 RepID=UPI002619A5FA|nr:hypothetical protein [uncultured Tenacibaculum sp.]